MKRDFEKEYREYMTESTPDLWSRIEAGLNSENQNSIPQTFPRQASAIQPSAEQGLNRQATAKTPSTRQEFTRQTSDRQPGSGNPSGLKRKTLLSYTRVLIPAAACICVLLLCINTLRHTRQAEFNKSAMGTAKEEYETFSAPATDAIQEAELQAEEAPQAAGIFDAANETADSDEGSFEKATTAGESYVAAGSAAESFAANSAGESFAAADSADESFAAESANESFAAVSSSAESLNASGSSAEPFTPIGSANPSQRLPTRIRLLQMTSPFFKYLETGDGSLYPFPEI